MIDIGANIGDTAAMIASYADNDLKLEEPSHYYARLLRYNITKLPNKTEVIEALIGNRDCIQGELNHWGGTAYLHETKDPKTGSNLPTLSLSEITKQPVCLIKVDTDGQDYSIILGNEFLLREHRPVLLFENAVRNPRELNQALNAFKSLQAAEYSNFIVWDDPG